MPCALAEPGNYPDYLKSILKEINNGNDDELKTCACSLRTPTTDEGCIIPDEDGKLLAFPFCLPTEPIVINYNIQNNATASIGLSYKQAMNIYWKRKPFTMEFKADGVGIENCSPGDPPGKSIGSTSFQCEEVSLKDLVCATSKGGTVDSNDPASLEPNARKGLTRRSDSCYSEPPVPYFGVTFEIFAPNFKLVGEQYIIERPWIDREAKKIYPVIYVYQNLNGCCGVLGPTNGSTADSSITINCASDEGGTGTVKITDFMA